MTTEQHLDKWIDANIPEEERDEVRQAMLRLVWEDEEYWAALGWWRVYDHCKTLAPPTD